MCSKCLQWLVFIKLAKKKFASAGGNKGYMVTFDKLSYIGILLLAALSLTEHCYSNGHFKELSHDILKSL